MEQFVITQADLMLFAKWQAFILLIPFLMQMVTPLVERLVDVLFDRLGLRARLARRRNPRFVLDSYRNWVTFRRDRALNERYRHYEP